MCKNLKKGEEVVVYEKIKPEKYCATNNRGK